MTINELANAFLSIEPQTHKKLQKLCYYAYAWYIAQTDDRLFDEGFEAWVHGPVNVNLYKRFRYDENIIGDWAIIPKYEGYIDPEAKAVAEWVYEAYGDLSGFELEMMTHREDPWIKARGDKKSWERSNSTISDDDIKAYYREQLYGTST